MASKFPDINDRFNDLLFKLAHNLYQQGLTLGLTDLVEPQQGWTDYDLLKAAVQNSAKLAS